MWVPAVVAAATALVGAMWRAVSRTTEAKVAKVEADAARAVAEAEARVAKATVTAERQMLAELRDRLPTSGGVLSKGQTLQQEIESP
jgi:hypothetical protein